VAAFNLFAMMAITVVDVVGRYLFNAPLHGAFELTEVMMGVLVFAVLPLVTAADDHITIGLLEAVFRGPARRAKEVLVTAVSTAFVATVAWRVWIEAGRMAEYEDRTAFLGLPLWPLSYFMAVMAAVTAAVLAALLIGQLARRPDDR
jgi:TRAP-type C4-dicarboxylate transport system permease small subunit